MKTTQVFNLKWGKVRVSCVYIHNTTNPYRLYTLTRATDRYGYPTEHRKQIAKYADLTSVLYHVYRLSL